jgi:hypothetical protein
MAPSNLLLPLELTSRFRKWVNSLPPADQRKVLDAVIAAQKAIGTPHSHKGAGIRKLRRSVMECRAGLHLRMAFLCEPHRLTFVAGGNHDDIRRFLKTV